MMQEPAAILKQTILFQTLSEETIEREILPHGFSQTYTKDQFLIVPQQQMNRFGIVLRGKIHIQHIFTNGTCRLMRTVSEREILGADLIWTRSRVSPYHAAAASPAQVFYLPADLLTAPGYLSESTRLACLNRLLLLISQENMKKEYRLAILSQSGLRDRILTYLTMQANRQNKASFTIPFTREELASFLCVNRSSLSHELSLLQQEGVISFRKNEFTLHQRSPDLLPL